MKKIDLDLDTVKKMYIEDGLTCIEVANKLGVSRIMINRFLNKNGIKKSKEEISKSRTERYKKTCLEKYGVENPNQSNIVKEKKKQTCLEKYGVESPLQSEEIKDKIKQSCLEKYGVEHVAKSEEVREKAKQTCLEKYGVENISQSEEIKEKYKQTCLNKYGVENAAQSEKVKEKNKRTCLDKYGVEYVLQSDTVREKSRRTCLDKYGVEYISQSKEIKDKKKQTCLDKYGVEYSLQSEEIRDKIEQALFEKYGIKNVSQKDIPEESMKILFSKDDLQNFINNCEVKTTKDISSKLNIAYTTLNKYINEYDLRDLIDYSVSSGESDIKEYVESLGVIVEKDRNILDGKEIDIYCPEYKIGIEFNGDYWHSDANREKNYHYKKSLLAQEKGIRLIHIYEYEWNDPVKQNIIKSMLRIAFGKVENRIYARNCEIREITNAEARDFNNANHLQGHKNAQVTYGLFYENNLVQLMSFSYYPKKGWWEIERGCPGSNNVIIGGVSKLFKHFLKEYNPNKVFSYCDFNKFDGVGYEKLGMELLGYTGPDMKWLLKDGTVVNRQPSKHKELSENAQGKIWGAGSKRYLWKKEP